MTLTGYALPDASTIFRRVMENGIAVLIYENPAVESVMLYGSLRAGSMYEPISHSGLASMTGAALMRGTRSKDFDAIHSTLEDIGAEFDYGSGKYRLSFSGRSLAEDLRVLVDVLADTVRNPIFPEAEIEEERSKRITELKYAEQNTRYVAARAFREALYPEGHPYYYSTYGSLESLPTLTRSDLEGFHAAQYGPDEMIIVVVGAVKAEPTYRMIEDTLSGWSNPRQAAKPDTGQVASPQHLIRVHVPIPGKTQSDIVIGTIGPSRYDAAYRAATLANSILGEFGMMGRIGNTIREKLGLAYYAYSRLEAGEGPGAWHITAGVAPENVELAIEKTREEISRMLNEPVSEADLSDNQSYFTGRLPLRLESNGGIANTLHSMERYRLGLDYLSNYREDVYRITQADIQQVIQRYLSADHLVIATAGPR
jgi:zinc protease